MQFKCNLNTFKSYNLHTFHSFITRFKRMYFRTTITLSLFNKKLNNYTYIKENIWIIYK